MAAQSKAATVTGWILQVWMAVVFLFAGGAKLAGAAQAVQMYDAIGWGQWFRYVTGAIEVGSAILLLVHAARRTRRTPARLYDGRCRGRPCDRSAQSTDGTHRAHAVVGRDSVDPRGTARRLVRHSAGNAGRIRERNKSLTSFGASRLRLSSHQFSTRMNVDATYWTRRSEDATDQQFVLSRQCM